MDKVQKHNFFRDNFTFTFCMRFGTRTTCLLFPECSGILKAYIYGSACTQNYIRGGGGEFHTSHLKKGKGIGYRAWIENEFERWVT
jgi:hypothetical protein